MECIAGSSQVTVLSFEYLMIALVVASPDLKVEGEQKEDGINEFRGSGGSNFFLPDATSMV